MCQNIFFLLSFFLTSAWCLAQGTLISPGQQSDIELINCARINDKGTQFGPAVYGDQLVFVKRPKRGNVDPISKQTYFKLFKATCSPDGDPGSPKPFSVELNSSYNEGPVSFTQDDRVIFFTRTQLEAGGPKEDLEGVAQLGIYSAYRAEYDWAGIRALPFNGSNFSNQHPSVTPNGKRVFFASNQEGGYGGYDLYFSDFREGYWSEAINLGPEINTEGNEAFPYIHPNGRLFFASDGHGGLGGYDLFLVDLSQRRWGQLLNLPAPVNSPGDDVGIVLSKEGSSGYMVSNRVGGKGMDDIYRLQLARGFSSLEASRKDGAVITVYDGATSQRVQGAEVWLAVANNAGRFSTDLYSFAVAPQNNRSEIKLRAKPFGTLPATDLITDREGSTRLELKVGATYEVRVYRPGYRPESLRFVFTEEGPSRPLAITLQPISCTLVSGRMTTTTGEGAGGVPFQFRPQGCNAASVSGITDLAGYYEICLAPGCNYLLSAGRPGLETGVAQLSAQQLAGNRHPRQDLVLKYEAGLSRRGTDADNAILPLPGITYYGNTGSLNEVNSGDLDLLTQLLKDRPDLQLLLIAHADGPGDDYSMVRLGDQRANNLKEALLRRGIAPDRLKTVSYGRQYRIKPCTNCAPEDWAKNSRMEAKVIGG